MPDQFRNVYEDVERAAAYARLEYPGTYYLAFRDLPWILQQSVQGARALDFGCGTGRSTRFLRNLGYQVTGIDISEPMLAQARARDPSGDYRLLPRDAPPALPPEAYDLVLAAFTFDNVPSSDQKIGLFRALRASLTPLGRIVVIVSSPAVYLHEWASFSTRAFPENHAARSGDLVRAVMLDVPDSRPVEDILCTDETYRSVFTQAGLEVIATHRPLGYPAEPYSWVSETSVAPWAIYVLGSPAPSAGPG
ncbi:MAG: class I SAM-dependent methyltransferase [Gemmatimonadales bacterium]